VPYEYRHWARKRPPQYEELGERRLDAYLTVIAAVTAAIGLASSRFEDDISSLVVVAVVAATLVLIFGLMTLRRIIGRNVATSDFMNGLRRIRAFLVQANPEAATILPYPPKHQPIQRRRDSVWRLGNAGLLETVAAVNGGLAAVIVAGTTRLAEGSVLLSLLSGLVAAVLGWPAQLKWAKDTYPKVTAKRAENRKADLDSWQRRTHPSALDQDEDREVFRVGVGLVVLNQLELVLALERSDAPGSWQLPQGGLRSGEDPETAAWRELKEETGLGPNQVLLERTVDLWVGYELPHELRSIKTGRGQVHKWHIFRLQPDVELPPLPRNEEAEFRDSRWMTFSELLDKAVAFRRPAYERIAMWIIA
jgi:putative (di)nucleoside polyphosphate hydrolase